MADQRYMIIPGDTRWSIGRLTDGTSAWTRVAPPGEAADTVEAVAMAHAAGQALDRMGYRGEPVLLGLPSSWCLAATIMVDGLERSGRRRAMAFRLEEHLPLSAEQMIADYIRLSSDEALGVCCEFSRIQPIVQGCEAAGVAIGPICPVALLAGAAVAGENQVDVVFLSASAQDQSAEAIPDCDLIELQSDRPRRWWWLADQPAAAQQRALELAQAADRPIRLAAVGCDEPPLAGLKASDAISEVHLEASSVEDVALTEAGRVLAGRSVPWVNLRREALAGATARVAMPGSMIAATIALLAFLISVSVVCIWRGQTYQAMARAADQRQSQLFKEALPDQPIPPAGSIKRRLISEQRRLDDLGRGAASGDGGQVAVDALDQLRLILTHLPEDIRFRIVDLNIQPELIRVDGEARNHLEAERLAMALRDSAAYQVEPPNTEAIDDKRVNFLFTGRLRPGALGESDGTDPNQRGEQ
jgi:hypothetical protein